MKTRLIIFSILLFFTTSLIGNAAPPADVKGPSAALDYAASKADFKVGSPEERLNTLISTSIKAFLGLLGVLFLALIIYGGFMWMNAQGVEEDIAKAKRILTAAIIGIIIVMASYAITDFVLQALESETMGGEGGTTTPPP